MPKGTQQKTPEKFGNTQQTRDIVQLVGEGGLPMAAACA
jgi:hypothetical protein